MFNPIGTLAGYRNTLGGMDVLVKDAQEQRRTPCDVRGPWVRPKVPNKRAGRSGTRRMWKRRNPPHHIMLYREPTDVVKFHNTLIVTPLQWDALLRKTKPADERLYGKYTNTLGGMCL